MRGLTRIGLGLAKRLRGLFTRGGAAVEAPAPPKPLIAAPGLAPDWLPEFQGAWQVFLREPAGQALMARMRSVSALVARKACADVFHTSHSAGVARGWDEATQWLESLSRTSDRAKNAESTEAGEGATDLRELLAP